MYNYCDRCILKSVASVIVVCWMGCRHNQCNDCAQITKQEAEEWKAYVERRR